MKDLGELHHFSGMEVQRTGDGLFLSQCQYMIDILNRAGMADCKPVSTPVDCNPKLSADGVPVQDATDFQSLVGALHYPWHFHSAEHRLCCSANLSVHA